MHFLIKDDVFALQKIIEIKRNSTKMEDAVMRLNFPNQSRSFDDSKSRVCFWGYDKTIEVSFYVETDALKKLCPKLSEAEAGYLQAFDSKRKKIEKVASNIYENNKQGAFSYIISAKDFNVL
ncbi:MAG: DUF1488 domain-containing protein [Gammaproteobacteria bacterium]|nr:DUF1488 domain-containing protein [Gammaproteobacteria bacterium]